MTQNTPKPLFDKAATQSFVDQQIANNPYARKATPVTLQPVAEQVTATTFQPVPNAAGVKSAELSVFSAGTNVGKNSFAPVSPKQLADLGASSPRTLQLLAAFESPTGVLEFGQDLMTVISTKSTQLMDEVKDSDVEFVQTQMSSLLTMAKSFHLKPNGVQSQKGLHGLINSIKEKFVDVKEQMLAEYNNISTQMDRIVSEVEQANGRILQKVKGLQDQYRTNLKDYNDLEQLIKDGGEAYTIKLKQLAELKDKAVASGDMLAAEEVSRLSRNLDRLDKKLADLKKFQLMCLQDAPDFANMEESALTLLDKFYTIKTMVIPLWKKQIRKYIDGQEIARAAKLANAVDDATNQMIVNSSNANKATAVEVAKLGQRGAIDDNTAETVHQNLLETLADVLEINDQGRQARITSANRQDEMKRMYAAISSGQLSAANAKALPKGHA